MIALQVNMDDAINGPALNQFFLNEQNPMENEQLIPLVLNFLKSGNGVYVIWGLLATLLIANVALSKDGIATLDGRLTEINANLEELVVNCQLAELVYHERLVLEEGNKIMGGRGIWNITLGEHLQTRRQFVASCNRLMEEIQPTGPENTPISNNMTEDE